MDEIIDNLHLLVLNIGYMRCCTEWRFHDVCSPFTRLYYITDGEAEVDTPDGIIRLRPGYMYVIPAFTLHSCRCNKEFSHYYIHLYNEAGEYIFDDWQLPHEIKATSGDLQNVRRLAELCAGMELTRTNPFEYDNSPAMHDCIEQNKRREAWARIESRGLLYLLISRFIRMATPKHQVADERVRVVQSYMRSHLNAKVCMVQLADMVHLSYAHLKRLFIQHLGTTPMRYFNDLLIREIQRRLITGNMSVKDIAYNLGFDDVAYFCRMFKLHTGLTPMGYRREYKN